MHRIAFAVWIVNLIMALVSFVYPMPTIWFFPLFLWCLIGIAEAGHRDHPEKDAPKWVRNIMAVCNVFVVVNTAVSMMLLWEGGPRVNDGIYCVMSHGDFVREISYAEYMCLMRAESRLMFGGILVLSSDVMGKHFGIHAQK